MTRPKTEKRNVRRQSRAKAPGRGLPRYAWLLIAVAVAGIIVLARLYPPGQCPRDSLAPPRAAIVDQLSVLQENPAFITAVTRELEAQGFTVDLFQGDDITVDFYRKLPTHCYRLIVFRAHSGILEEEEQVHLKTTLFTNEEFDWKKHQADLLADRLFMASIGEDHPWVFSISPKFITSRSMKGRFNDTVIIMMGCAGIYLPDLAQAFVDKGASAYLAWDASVLLNYVDAATLHLIRQLCSEQASIREAVTSTMAAKGPDPHYDAELQYYPARTGDKTLAELTG